MEYTPDSTVPASEVGPADRISLPGLFEDALLVEDTRFVDLGSGSLDYTEITVWAPIAAGRETMVCVTVERDQLVLTWSEA